MIESRFTSEDFDSLAYIKKFNSIHWKDGLIGWNYDVKSNDYSITKIKDSLRKIKDKLEKLRIYFAEKKEYQGLTSGVQKITLGITNEYLSQLWIYFIKGLEEKYVNEPQLQFTIHNDCIEIGLWFNNKISTEKYLKTLILKHSDLLKKDPLISFEVYEPELDGNQIGSYSNTEFETFKKQISNLKFDCKVGFSFYIEKKEVLKQEEKIIFIIEGYFNRIKTLFDISIGNYQRIKSKNSKDGKLIFIPGNTTKKHWTKREIIVSKSDISLRHKIIQDKIFDLLVEKYGKKYVGTENKTGFGTKVDIVAHLYSKYYYYEIKTQPELKTCIREALGQLLEYSYWPKSTEADKLIIISENNITDEAISYLKFLREEMNLPIYYQEYNFNEDKLSELY